MNIVPSTYQAKMENKNRFLLPGRSRLLGILFSLSGVVLGIVRFRYGIKPESLNLKFFAFYSSYLEDKYMQIIRNNMCEEVVTFLLVAGLFLVAFSREKEENERTQAIRLKAFFLTAYLNALFLIVAIFFTYGFAFVYALMANMGFGLLAYIVSFRVMLFREKRKTKVSDNQNP